MDQNKRRTLKIMAGVSGSLTAAAFNGSAIAAGAPQTQSMQQNTTCGHLNIEIITGRTAPEDTVILTNDSDTELLISEFLPGLITQNNQMIDLNALLASGAIQVKPGYPVALKTARWELLSLDSGGSYLWCDSAVSLLPGSDTGIIKINAAIVNGRAMLTAEHKQPVLS